MGRCCVQLSLPEAIVQCMRHGGLQKLRLEESNGGKMSSYGKMEPEQRLVKDKGPHENLGHSTGSFPVAKLPGLLDRFEKFGHLPEGSY